MRCRHCGSELVHRFLDLGHAPPSNAYRTHADLQRPEVHFPLRARVCGACWLVQTEDYAEADLLFDADYAYFSSTSRGWVDHAARYAHEMIEGLGLGPDSFVIEVASNDGYLLRNFVDAGVPCLGVEPTASTADAAEAIGVPVLREFFGEDVAKGIARERGRADLIAGNNVYAHVPDINDFTVGLREALAPGGTVTLEFPHLQRMIEQVQFDTTYHEHFSYLSLHAVSRIFEAAGLRVFHVDQIPTHGGSLRVFGAHGDDARSTSEAVTRLLQEEVAAGLLDVDTYASFQTRADRVKDDLLAFLLEQKRSDKRVAAYGAAAKGNTLLNYGGVKPDLLEFVCDAAASKQGKFMPGSHIPIVAPEVLAERRPDFVLILPWNIADEVIAQQASVREWGGQFVTAVPTLQIRS